MDTRENDTAKKNAARKSEADLERDSQAAIKETWPVHAQPGAKDDARIAGKPGATSQG